MTQFAIITVTPAEHLTLRREGQRVAVRALGRRNLLDGAVWLEGQLLKCRLVIGVAQAKAAIASLPARPDGAVGGDDKRAVLTRLDLQSVEGKKCKL